MSILTSEQRAALRAELAPDIQAMQEALHTGVRALQASQLFNTPPEFAAQLIRRADIRPSHLVLDPSAGNGALIRAVLDVAPAAFVAAVEVQPALVQRLQLRFPGVLASCADFLSCGPALGRFDRIVMNPPFVRGQDIAHILHAVKFLKPGGRLAAICASGPRQHDTLRRLVDESGGEWDELPEDAFACEGTGVRTAMLFFDAALGPA